MVAQMVKSLPAVRETQVRSLDQEDPLEKEMATHSSILVRKIPRMEEPGQLQSVGSQRVGHDWTTSLSFFLFLYGCESWLSTKELTLSNCGAGEDSWETLGLQGDQPVNLKGNQLWIFIGRTDAEAEAPILWPPDAKNWFTGKDPDAGKDRGTWGKGGDRGWDICLG